MFNVCRMSVRAFETYHCVTHVYEIVLIIEHAATFKVTQRACVTHMDGLHI